jgi:hypothetical protein
MTSSIGWLTKNKVGNGFLYLGALIGWFFTLNFVFQKFFANEFTATIIGFVLLGGWILISEVFAKAFKTVGYSWISLFWLSAGVFFYARPSCWGVLPFMGGFFLASLWFIYAIGYKKNLVSFLSLPALIWCGFFYIPQARELARDLPGLVWIHLILGTTLLAVFFVRSVVALEPLRTQGATSPLSLIRRRRQDS